MLHFPSLLADITTLLMYDAPLPGDNKLLLANNVSYLADFGL